MTEGLNKPVVQDFYNQFGSFLKALNGELKITMLTLRVNSKPHHRDNFCLSLSQNSTLFEI